MISRYPSGERQPTGATFGGSDRSMPKGHKCKVCGQYKLQPYTTNQLRCSNCQTVVKKDAL